jgi:hypothetical protein
MEIEIIGMILIFTIIVVIGISIVLSLTSFKNLLPSQFSNVYNKVVTSIGFKSPYNICQSFSGQKISLQDFQTLLQASYNGQCGSSHANVSLSFSLAKGDLQRIAALDGIAMDGKLIFYNYTSPLGIGGILVQGDPGQYPLKNDDYIDLYAAGSPLQDVLIRVTLKGCDPYDSVCNPVCVLKGICQPACDDGQRHNLPCNLACILGQDKLDPYANNVINEANAANRIATGKCNPDCYGNTTNPFKAYDPGCVWKYKNQNDNICDPNSNGVRDGICDPDCVKTTNICDPDCNGTVYAGNPYGLNDTKCFVCDGTCNGWCSPACSKNALPGDLGFDPDCYRQLNSSFFCPGDGMCDQIRGENCANSVDCPGGGMTCGDYHGACCPSANDADISGCSNTINLEEGGSCSCGTQCASGLTCDNTNHCCPEGKTWNGTACNFQYTFTILYVQLNSQISNFAAKAEAGKNLWVQLTPLNNCPDKVREIAVTDKICNVPDQSGMCSSDPNVQNQVAQDTYQDILNCANSWGYGGTYTRIVGVTNGPETPIGQAVCSTGQGATLGYTDIGSGIMISSGDESQVEETSSHEMGHTFGLCDEGYGIAPCSDCNSLPNGICGFGGLSCYPPVNKQQCLQMQGTVCPNVPSPNSIHCTAYCWEFPGNQYDYNAPCTVGSAFDSSEMPWLEKVLSPYCK